MEEAQTSLRGHTSGFQIGRHFPPFWRKWAWEILHMHLKAGLLSPEPMGTPRDAFQGPATTLQPFTVPSQRCCCCGLPRLRSQDPGHPAAAHPAPSSSRRHLSPAMFSASPPPHGHWCPSPCHIHSRGKRGAAWLRARSSGHKSLSGASVTAPKSHSN